MASVWPATWQTDVRDRCQGHAPVHTREYRPPGPIGNLLYSQQGTAYVPTAGEGKIRSTVYRSEVLVHGQAVAWSGLPPPCTAGICGCVCGIPSTRPGIRLQPGKEPRASGPKLNGSRKKRGSQAGRGWIGSTAGISACSPHRSRQVVCPGCPRRDMQIPAQYAGRRIVG